MLPRRVPYSPVVVPGLAVACLMAPWLSSRLAAQTMGIRQVSASAENVIPLQTRLRYTTMVVLPEDEEILDVICGDIEGFLLSCAVAIPQIQTPRLSLRPMILDYAERLYDVFSDPEAVRYWNRPDKRRDTMKGDAIDNLRRGIRRRSEICRRGFTILSSSRRGETICLIRSP